MHVTTVAGPAGQLNLTDTGAIDSSPQPIPVLLIHGMAYHLGVWDETIALLRANLPENQRILAKVALLEEEAAWTPENLVALPPLRFARSCNQQLRTANRQTGTSSMEADRE